MSGKDSFMRSVNYAKRTGKVLPAHVKQLPITFNLKARLGRKPVDVDTIVFSGPDRGFKCLKVFGHLFCIIITLGA